MSARSHRSRPVYVVLLVLVVALGLGSRIYRGSIPRLLDLYAGDTLWATAVVLLLAILFPQARTRSLTLGAAAISLAVELSQLAHPAWLDTLRQVPGVALIIGYDFVWVDLACYAAGVLIGAVIDAAACRGIRRAPGRRIITVGLVGGLLLGAVVSTQLPMIGAGGLLHPARRPMTAATPEGCTAERIQGEGVDLGAWRCAADGERRGTLVYLHGIADNRASAGGAITRFRHRGFDVIAYDSRAHGDSGGEMCTYGFYERRDLGRLIDTLDAGPIVLLGTSLGAAVALQHAAEDPRVTAVVSAEAFSDLATVATERAPAFFTIGIIDRAFAIAEERARFQIEAVSPRTAAQRIRVPVLIVHGERDHETPPEHSRRIFSALQGPKELLLVPDVGHNQSLTGEVWQRIEQWIDRHVPR